jgi:hypothetical protein
MRYGFTKDGGFVAVDDDARIGHFAYPSSPLLRRAKRDDSTVAATMLLDRQTYCPPDIRERHYLRCVASWESSTRRPV